MQTGVYLSAFFSNFPTQKVIDDIFIIINTNDLHPLISKVFSLNEIGQAHQLMEHNDANGKVVIRFNHE